MSSPPPIVVHRLVEMLATAKEQAESVLDRIPGVCAIVDARGSIIRGNATLAQLLGAHPETLHRLTLEQLLPAPSWQLFQQHLLAAAAGDSDSELQLMLKRTLAGEPRAYAWTLAPLSRGGGNDRCPLILVLGRDITALLSYERQLKELEIAKQIQVGLIPRSPSAPGYEIAGLIVPAEDVGGDYYDVLAYDEALWVAIGDVTSHGLLSGLAMLMAQSAFGSLTARDPMASPKDVFADLNRSLYRNLRERLGCDNHMTLTLLRSDGPGRFLFSGAHLDIAIRRAATGAVERVATPGCWAGLIPECADALELHSLQLERGDMMVLHTDGVPEAKAPDGEEFGDQRMAAMIGDQRGGPAELCDALWQAVAGHMNGRPQDDDVTLVAVRRVE